MYSRLIATGLLLAGLVSPPINASDKKPELVFLSWSEYIDPELIMEFEARCDCTVKEVYFESDDARDNILVNSNATGYDVMMVNGVRMSTYVNRGWLAPVTPDEVPNLKHIYPKWLDAFADVRGHGAPYFWGSLGIAYRSDLVEYEITSMLDLLRPAPELHGKILMINGSRDLIGMTLKALGYSANTGDLEQLREAQALLLEQKPAVIGYDYVSLTENSSLLTGDVWATMMYSGDALMLADIDENVKYVVPSEGTILWVDYLTIASNSNNKGLAADFINFLNEPEIAARLAEWVFHASPNRAAEAYLPADLLEDPVIYPDIEGMERSEFMRPLPPRVQRSLNNIANTVMN